MKTTRLVAVVLVGSAILLVSRAAKAQEAEIPAPGGNPQDAEAAGAEGGLTSRQQHVADRFRELERLLLRMAELTAPTDPRRAALLRRAVAQSKDRAIEEQFDELLELLRQQRLATVVKNQGAVHDDLVKLLELLLSEDRSKRIESEKERIRQYLQQVNKIIKEQKGVQGETQREGDPEKLAGQQEKLADKTGELAKKIEAANGKKQDAGKDESEDSKDGEPSDKEGESKDAEGKPGDDKPADEKSQDKDSDKQDADKKGTEKKDADKKDADKKGGDPAPPVDPPDQPQQGEGQKGQDQQGEGQQGEQQPGQQQQAPAQQRLQQAQKRMQEAQKKLEEAQRKDAVEKQAEALRELEKAKAELEEILRQLREEEMARTLAMLEARFRKMLDAQIEVYEGTQRLDKVPQERRDRDDEIEAGRLSAKEAQIAIEADKALAILKEEGSAVAFPEAVVEIRDDMITVRDYLGEAKVGQLTQGVEQDIIAALEEMIAALQKAQKDLEDKNQQPPPDSGSGDFEMPLVDVISELKMIRALQMRVNTRTKRYGEMIETEQADRPELLTALKQLAERERRIHKVTRDIVVGRNR